MLCGIPVLIARGRAAFLDSKLVLVCAWACPLVCAGMTLAVLWAQRAVDRTTGLLAGISACPLSESALVVSRVLTGLFVFAVQMLAFACVLVIRFRI